MSRSHVAAHVLVAATAALSAAAVHAQVGTPQWSVSFEDMEGQSSFITDLRAGNDGVTVGLLRSSARLTDGGARQWHITAEPVCTVDQTLHRISAVESLPDNESWVLRSCYSSNGADARHVLTRIDDDGASAIQADLHASGALWQYTRLFARPDGVLALVPHPNGVRWLRMDSNGNVIDDAFTELARTHQRVTFPYVRMWPNGSASIAVWQGPNGCNADPPTVCPRPATTLLRLSADGTERWRVEAGEFYGFVGFDDDGSSLIARSTYGTELRLRQVSATGVAGPTFIAADGERMHLTGEAGPVRGRYLAVSETEQLLIGRDGRVLARRPDGSTAGGKAYASGTHGFITGAWLSDGALVSADDLSVLAYFDLDGVDNTSWDISGDLYWRLLDDGTVYTNVRRTSDVTPPPQRARTSRFAVPGTPAADLVFVDRFD
ncbi:MAG TPA: hypothetical protein VLF18_05930 [Tahibacter sp.]|uniref:hypothetical protein n=1 Tax=Tahibacter sp. TaxID=2056211 RepID=UPI002C15587C|nr:hypothetical protein [Tahibacter sp.]HSX59719.1 hypothetical protein [Tahibacter sp.]